MRSFFNKIPKYWLFQFLGWGSFVCINLFFAVSFKILDQQFIVRLSTFVVVGIIMSHLMRELINRVRLMSRTLNEQLIGFILISSLFAGVIGVLETVLINIAGLEYAEEKSLSLMQKISSNVFTSFIYFFIWNCIYFIYHYIGQSRKNQLDNLKLEALVKSLELKTIKSHINPHFIFNALNSIRALIDEDPLRARTAITALSNILRSSMSSDLQETITLEKELNIVRDYLALEQIRFEDRLKVVYEIEEEALDNPVPPMMLQTLVENAIKHGIGKTLHGGEVRIAAKEFDHTYSLTVWNTGELIMETNHEGFGIQSTESRLKLIFGDSARFNIRQLSADTVESCIEIPIN